MTIRELSDAELAIIRQVLLSDVVKWALGAENWDLSEDDEDKLWAIIEKLRG